MPDHEMIYRFRTSLHGFNREDVVSYIETSGREYEEELQKLRSANEGLRAQLQEATAAIAEAEQFRNAAQELEAARRRISALEGEKQGLMDQLADLEEQLRAAQSAASERQPVAETAVQPDLSEPILPIETVVPAEIAPEKDYTELELAAYRRAEMAERMAKDRAQEVYRKVQSIFGNASARLDTGKADLDQMTRTIRDDVDQMLLLLNNIMSAYEDAQTSFGAVSDGN